MVDRGSYMVDGGHLYMVDGGWDQQTRLPLGQWPVQLRAWRHLRHVLHKFGVGFDLF